MAYPSEEKMWRLAWWLVAVLLVCAGHCDDAADSSQAAGAGGEGGEVQQEGLSAEHGAEEEHGHDEHRYRSSNKYVIFILTTPPPPLPPKCCESGFGRMDLTQIGYRSLQSTGTGSLLIRSLTGPQQRIQIKNLCFRIAVCFSCRLEIL